MNDRDTTSMDGAACAGCGDDSTNVTQVLEEGRMVRRPFCDHCYDAAIASCPECLITFWQSDGWRIGKDFLCDPCGKIHPAVVGATMAGILADARGNK